LVLKDQKIGNKWRRRREFG